MILGTRARLQPRRGDHNLAQRFSAGKSGKTPGKSRRDGPVLKQSLQRRWGVGDQRVEQPRSRLRHTPIAHDVGQQVRVQHGVKRVEHPAQSSRQQCAALLGRCLSQELNRADGHAGSDCVSGGGIQGQKPEEAQCAGIVQDLMSGVTPDYIGKLCCSYAALSELGLLRVESRP
jgi:hypothetical protein